MPGILVVDIIIDKVLGRSLAESYLAEFVCTIPHNGFGSESLTIIGFGLHFFDGDTGITARRHKCQLSVVVRPAGNTLGHGEVIGTDGESQLIHLASLESLGRNGEMGFTRSRVRRSMTSSNDKIGCGHCLRRYKHGTAVGHLDLSTVAQAGIGRVVKWCLIVSLQHIEFDRAIDTCTILAARSAANDNLVVHCNARFTDSRDNNLGHFMLERKIDDLVVLIVVDDTCQHQVANLVVVIGRLVVLDGKGVVIAFIGVLFKGRRSNNGTGAHDADRRAFACQVVRSAADGGQIIVFTT